jgi:hypothetical protein
MIKDIYLPHNPGAFNHLLFESFKWHILYASHNDTYKHTKNK